METRFAIEPDYLTPEITSPWGNYLPLTDPMGRLVENAAQIVLGFIYFPDDIVTAWSYVQAFELMADDPTLGEFQGADPYIAKWISKSVRSTLQQRQNAQLIGSFLLAGAATSRPVSLRQAVFGAQHVLIHGASWQGPRHPQDSKESLINAFGSAAMAA